jgi:hypothetical protein
VGGLAWSQNITQAAGMSRVGFLVLLFCGPLFAHPAHVSIAEMEWVRSSNRFEVSLKVDPEGLELALAGMLGRQLQLLGEGRLDRPLEQLMKARFSLTPVDQAPLALNWVGYEMTHQGIWLYFEFHLTADQTRFRISNRLLLGKRAQQVNTVNLKAGDQHRTFRFHRDSPEALLDLSAQAGRP